MPILAREGVRLSYSRTGTGPAVLLVQGVGVIGNGWRPQIDGLARDFTLVAFDHRGIGQSDPGGDPLSVELLAADALAIADAEGLQRFHLAGHSLGGLIAQAIALSARPRVVSLALLCTFARGRDGAALRSDLVALGLRTRLGTRAMRRRAFLRIVMPDAYLAGVDGDALATALAPLFGRDLAEQPPIIMKQLKAMSVYDALARLTALEGLPTLIVSAEHDRIARVSSGRALAAAIPGARFVEIPGAGHGVTIQKAAEINQLLADHWRRA